MDMNMLIRRASAIAIILSLSISFVSATRVADSSWYDISCTTLAPSGANLYDNSVDISYTTPVNVNFARILTGLNHPVPPGYEQLGLRFSTPGGMFKFEKVSDPTKWADVQVRLEHEGNPTQQVSPSDTYPIIAGMSPTVTDLFIDLNSQLPNGVPWRGDYYFPLSIEILDRDGNVLWSETLRMTVHLRDKDTTGPRITSIVIDQYPAAREIPFCYPYQPGLPVIKVGSVNFQSNEEYQKYRLRVSPVGQTEFQFNHTNGYPGGAIKYRVTIPGRTTLSYEQAFDVDLDYQGQVGAWYDFLEVGVRDINYHNTRGIAGTYASTIRIDLVSF